MSNDWLNDLRRKMENHTDDVPDELWDDIRYKLFEEEKTKAPILIQMNDDLKTEKKAIKNNKKHQSLYYRIGGIAAAIAMFFILDRLIDFNSKKEQSQVSEYANKSGETIYNDQKPAIDKNDGSTENSLEERRGVIVMNSGKEKRRNHILDKNIFINKTNSKIDFWKENTFEVQTKSNDNILMQDAKRLVQTENLNLGKQQENIEESTHELLTKQEREWKGKFEDSEKARLAKNKSKKKWMVGVLTGNTSSNSTDQFPGYATLNGTTLSLPEVWSVGFEENPLMEILLANQDKKVDAKIKHKTPVTFGASVYYNIGKKWGIGTGINYTKLSAEVVSGSSDNFISSEQNIHYLGLPVQVNYNVIQKGAFTAYITGGGVVEKAISGQIKTKYIVDGLPKEETKEDISEKPVQVSANTAVGFQLKILKQIGVYAEPGIGYHFNDNSNLKTIYKEKPVNFNLKFGIRVSIN
ncbi:MAG: hypothetical protein K0R77_1127 [Chryseobacterium sp.]|jgi:hypothetical protein|uniref:outer membrane beta-barrel protein n=1 Tax=Chryseobacterium sp. TaxID=1871047 RepID=UPI00262EB8DF|nr:outer membrane beta-barrel protein [Chryseobacterium sp.]MDF2551852.1 hypothetical protein [Chryseobacterium sp.]